MAKLAAVKLILIFNNNIELNEHCYYSTAFSGEFLLLLTLYMCSCRYLFVLYLPNLRFKKNFDMILHFCFT